MTVLPSYLLEKHIVTLQVLMDEHHHRREREEEEEEEIKSDIFERKSVDHTKRNSLKNATACRYFVLVLAFLYTTAKNYIYYTFLQH